MNFQQIAQLIEKTGHRIVTLNAPGRDRPVMVCPTLAGRVMGTSYDGVAGSIGGFIDIKAFQQGITDIWDNWGGEERYWLCPEGGQFGLMFKGRENCFDNYTVQDGINNSRYEVVEQAKTGDSLTMAARFPIVNAMGTKFDVQSTRRITALADCPFAVDTAGDVECVGFQSESTITNLGKEAWSKPTGSLAHWHIGQYPLGPRTVVIVPFKQGDIVDPPIREDYFREFCIDGRMSPQAYWLRQGFTLLKADGHTRTKIGQNRSRATGLMGSFNLDTNEMIFLQYDFYPNLEYAASYWYEQPEPYNGDCISVSVEGPGERGGAPGRCYELEAMSPAMLLAPKESFTFRTRVFHVRGPRTVMGRICRQQLSPELSTLEAFDAQSR